ncbi:MAG: hypothetical protein WD894_05425 [Pirellulales bacterium]
MLRFTFAGVLTLALGCGGPSVTFPEPRAPADDEEESPRVEVASSTAQNAAQRARSPAVKPAPAPAKESSPPRTRGAAVTAAAERAMRGAGDEENRPAQVALRDADEGSPTTRPANLSAWTHDDFRTAKQERDARLVQAVPLLGNSNGNAQANARLLLELLDEPSPAAPTSARHPTVMHGLAQAIVTALAANSSDVAQHALKEILLGKLQTNLDDRSFTMAALAALFNRGGAEAEVLVYTVLTMPDAVRPTGRSTFTGEALQKECVTLVRNSASQQLRLRLAQYTAHPSTPTAHRALLLPMLLEPRGENLAAQAALALADNFDAGQRTTLQRQLLAHARRSIDTLMGAPDTPLLRATDDAAIRSVFAAREPAPLEESRRSVEQLWSQTFVDRLVRQLSEVRGATDQPDLFALATSLPSDALRPIVRKHLTDHWTQGASLISAPQFTPTAMRDPGMLLVLKSLPREDAQARRSPVRIRGNSPQQQRLLQELKARQAWTSAAQSMSNTLMRRCEIAGRVSRIAADATSPVQSARPLESVADLNRLLEFRNEATQQADAADDPPQGATGTDALSFPLELPTAAELETSYQLQWPEQLEGRVHTAVSPLTMHYARLRVEDQGQRAVSFFARQLKSAQDRPLENGRWLDSASLSAPGKLRSIDIMITRSKPLSNITPVSNRNTVEELTVEILWIEISDFMSTTIQRPQS